MRTVLVAVLSLAALAYAPSPPITAGVYHWAASKAEQHGGRTVRLIASGSTLDLESLDVRAITLEAGVSDSGAMHERDELFLMVKEGDLRVTQAGVTKVLGVGSVAVALPGERQIVSNASATPAAYYLLTYRSRAPMDLARGTQAGGSFMVDWNDQAVRTTASGTRRDVLNRPTAMWKRFEAHASTVGEGLRNHATHSHRADEIMLMMKGEVEMSIGDTHLPAAASDVVFLGSMIPHSLGSTGSGPAQYLVIQGE